LDELAAIKENNSRLRFRHMRHQTKSSLIVISSRPVNHASTWLETPLHYVTIGYRDQRLGLLVETGDEEEARREAEELCTGLDGLMRILSVSKVVLQ
jgi:hypothetical protein